MRTRVRQDALQVLATLWCGLVLAGAGWALRSDDGPSAWGLEQALGTGLSWLGLGIVALWTLALLSGVVAAILHRTGRHTTAHVATCVTPAVMRRLAAALVGVNLLAAPAVAQASSPELGTAHPVSSVGGPAPSTRIGGIMNGAIDGAESSRAAPSPYWSTGAPSGDAPDVRSSPSGAADTASGSETSPAPLSHISPGWTPAPVPVEGGLLLRQETRPTTGRSEVVVAPGDSLWSIVASQLGPLATAAEVAEAWPGWFDANRTVIGDDPSLLIPGQVLRSPA